MFQSGIVITISLLYLFVATSVAQRSNTWRQQPNQRGGNRGAMRGMDAGELFEQTTGKIKISYFNITGRAEPIRWILAYANFPFEDNRVADADWPTVKPTTPLGELPVLDLTSRDGKQKATLCQSGAITRYLAYRFGLLGATMKQVARADEAVETLRDLMQAILNIAYAPDDASKDELIQSTKTETVPHVLGFLENNIKKNGGKTVAGGNSYTYADIVVGAMWNIMGINLPDVDLTAYPKLSAIAKTVAQKNGVKAYLAKRPKTEI